MPPDRVAQAVFEQFEGHGNDVPPADRQPDRPLATAPDGASTDEDLEAGIERIHLSPRQQRQSLGD
jgi:hypothetical protein